MDRVLVDPVTNLAIGEQVELGPEQSRHLVRVRRAEAGSRVELLNGGGRRATGTVIGLGGPKRSPAAVVEVEEAHEEPPPHPWIEVWAATPKGDRLPTMVEQLGQVGAGAWRPLVSDRAVVDPGLRKLDRLRRIARESIKQSGRSHALEILEPMGMEAALEAPSANELLVVADPSGDHPRSLSGADPSRARVLIGPEGGWSPAELERARSAGARVTSLGGSIMRIGTAAVVATALAHTSLVS